jgi:hypothetical protein
METESDLRAAWWEVCLEDAHDVCVTDGRRT